MQRMDHDRLCSMDQAVFLSVFVWESERWLDTAIAFIFDMEKGASR